MTGEKRTETRMRCYNTLCIPYISLHPSLHACIVYDCREGRGVIYREYTECYSISFLFLFFFHQSSLYPIKIFAKCFYLLVIIKKIQVTEQPTERVEKVFTYCSCRVALKKFTSGKNIIVL